MTDYDKAIEAAWLAIDEHMVANYQAWGPNEMIDIIRSHIMPVVEVMKKESESKQFVMGWDRERGFYTDLPDGVYTVVNTMLRKVDGDGSYEYGHLARVAVTMVVDDLSDRRGLKNEWRQITPSIKKEIRKVWAKIIQKHISASLMEFIEDTDVLQEKVDKLETELAELKKANAE